MVEGGLECDEGQVFTRRRLGVETECGVVSRKKGETSGFCVYGMCVRSSLRYGSRGCERSREISYFCCADYGA